MEEMLSSKLQTLGDPIIGQAAIGGRGFIQVEFT